MSTYSKFITTNIQLFVNVVLFEKNEILVLCIKIKSTRNHIYDFIEGCCLIHILSQF